MPNFHYKAKNKNAATVFGQIFAQNRAEAVEKINHLGLMPIMVGEDSGKKTAKGLQPPRSVSGKTIYFFTRQLFNLTKSGVTILRALEIIALQQKNQSFRGVVESLRIAVQQGQSFSDALADYPKMFPALYVAMIRAGEESGTLKDALADLAEYLRTQQEISSRVRTALAYPFLMLVFGAGTVFFILTYVMPQITKLFDNLEQVLPLPTLIVMQISSVLSDWRMLLGLSALAFFVVAAARKFFKTASGQIALGNVLLKVPGLGAFMLKVDLARFARTLELLLHSGVPIVRSIKVALPVVANGVLRRELSRCYDDLVSGKSFSESLRNCRGIPEIFSYLIAVGEERGSLSQTLRDFTENSEQ